MAEPQFETVGKAFVAHYYQAFDTNRAGLGSLYQDQSMYLNLLREGRCVSGCPRLSWEGEKIQGQANILNKLTSLPFQQVAHQVTSMDSHPTAGDGVLVHVCGNLKVEGEAEDRPPLKYSQTFVLMPLPGGGGFWVLNDIFRLNYG